MFIYIYIYDIGFCDICVYSDISNICYLMYLIYVGVWKKNREFSWWSLLLLYSRRGHVTNESATLKADRHGTESPDSIAAIAHPHPHSACDVDDSLLNFGWQVEPFLHAAMLWHRVLAKGCQAHSGAQLPAAFGS